VVNVVRTVMNEQSILAFLSANLTRTSTYIVRYYWLSILLTTTGSKSLVLATPTLSVLASTTTAAAVQSTTAGYLLLELGSTTAFVPSSTSNSMLVLLRYVSDLCTATANQFYNQ